MLKHKTVHLPQKGKKQAREARKEINEALDATKALIVKTWDDLRQQAEPKPAAVAAARKKPAAKKKTEKKKTSKKKTRKKAG